MKLAFGSLLLMVAAAVAAAVPLRPNNLIATAPEPSTPSNSVSQDPTSIPVPSSDPSSTNNSRTGSSGPASSTDVSPASTDIGAPTSATSVQDSSTSILDSSTEATSQTSSTASLTSTDDARTTTPGQRSTTSDVASTTPSDTLSPSQTSSFRSSLSLSSSSSSSTAPSQPTTTPPTVDKQTYLNQHNRWRALVGADDLQWSDDLAAKAQGYAEKCQLQHSNGALGPVGENLVAGTGSFNADNAMSQFVLDRRDFNPSDLTFSHFTQVIWSSTTQLGCGVATCNELFPGHGAATYHVCLYDPVGNIVGEEILNLPHFE